MRFHNNTITLWNLKFHCDINQIKKKNTLKDISYNDQLKLIHFLCKRRVDL